MHIRKKDPELYTASTNIVLYHYFLFSANLSHCGNKDKIDNQGFFFFIFVLFGFFLLLQ